MNYERVKALGTLSTKPDGSRREVGIVSWNDRPAKLDIRTFKSDGTPGPGNIGKLTLTRKEAELLRNILSALNLEDIPE
jgi:hypothetical protein